jgi:cysteine desulfurase
MLRRVYLDHSATTPVLPEVLDAMLPYLTEKFGNSSSIHRFGQEAKAALDAARHKISHLINARPNEIVFTSGGTESNNLAIRGLIRSLGPGLGSEKPHIITSNIEHPAVKAVCEDLEKEGVEITFLPVYENGIVRIEDIASALRPETVLVSVMAANNEIGTIQPVEDIGRLVRERKAAGQKVWFHTDAVQAVGKIPIDVEAIGCDMLSISAHKMYSSKGVGALYLRRGVRLRPQNLGGRQERGSRGGTEAIPQIVGFGKAAEVVAENLESDSQRIKDLRDRLERGILESIRGTELNGDKDARLPNISNISFSGAEGEALLINLDMQGVAVSTGSACSSGSLEPSPVIRALGRTEDLARGAIRFSFGVSNSVGDVDHVLSVLPKAVETLRRLSPTYSHSATKK